MSYAIRIDLQGWRAVNGPEDCSVDEYYSETQPAPLEPDPQIAINAEARAYLLSTDWYVTRWQEKQTPIPAQISAERDAARARVVVR